MRFIIYCLITALGGFSIGTLARLGFYPIWVGVIVLIAFMYVMTRLYKYFED